MFPDTIICPVCNTVGHVSTTTIVTNSIIKMQTTCICHCCRAEWNETLRQSIAKNKECKDKNQINITVSGACGIGKSEIIKLLSNALIDAGYIQPHIDESAELDEEPIDSIGMFTYIDAPCDTTTLFTFYEEIVTYEERFRK